MTTLIFCIVAGIIITTILSIVAGYYYSAYKCALNEINTLETQMTKFVSQVEVYVNELNNDWRTLELQLDKLSSDLHVTQDQSENTNNECKEDN